MANDFARQYMREDVVGIVFLGAVARGYFDQSSDIDIGLFKRRTSDMSLTSQYLHIEGLEIHCWLSDYEDELHATWDMGRRWAYSERQIAYDPEGRIAALLEEKVPLKPNERKWLLMSGTALSEWYINRLSWLWVERGNLVSAHQMFEQGINHFFEMLFALNNELVPATKWKYYCAERLPQLPPDFRQHIQQTMILAEISVNELEKRKAAFMGMWRDILPLVETELQMPYAEFSQLV